jgi:hypothetical protein
MTIITKTIGAAGDYATPAAAAAAFNAGTVVGATTGDDIVFSIVDNAAFNSSFGITANPGGYISYKLTVDPAARHDGTYNSGARIAVAGTVTQVLGDSVAALNGTIEWLQITTSGSGKFAAGWNLNAGWSAGHKKQMLNCMMYRSNSHSTSPFRTVGIGNSASGVYSISPNLNVLNCVFANLKSGSPSVSVAIGTILTNASGNANIHNCTFHDIDVLGGTSGVAAGIVGVNGSQLSIKNCIATKIGVNTTSGTAQCFRSLGASTVRDSLVSSDSTATGTNSITGVSYASEMVDADAGDFRPSFAGQIYEGGVDLGTTDNVNIDLLGRDRDSEGDTWSIGAFQLSDVPVDSLTINTPTDYKIFQRNGSDEASVLISGVGYSNGDEAIEYRFAGGAWTPLVAGLTTGSFSATVTLPKGSGALEVRYSVSTGVSDSVASVGVGDIFIVAGQSNASGRLTSLQSYAHATFKSVVFDQDDATWRDLVDPTDPETTNGSIWPLLATLLMEDQGCPVGFITTAEGGTSSSQWSATAPGAKYTSAVGRVNGIAPNGVTALIWDQGESDAAASVSQSTYNTTLDGIAAGFQADTGLTLPMICDLVGYINPPGTLDEIRKAQIEAWDDNADIFPGANSITRASLHWESNAEGATHAALLWVAMDEALYGGPSARGPRLVSAVTISGTSTLTLTFDRDLLASDSSYTSTAFTVDNDDGTARTVSTATRTGNRTVVFALSGALDGTSPTVSFGLGNSAASATVPRTTAISLPATINSISSISVPAEPIYSYAVTVDPPDTTAPVIAAASVNTAGDTLTVTFTEADSPPLLPSSSATGVTLTSSTGGAITVSNGTRQSDLVFTFPLSRTIYDNETLLVGYLQSTGNITDSAVPTPNEVPDTASFAVANNSEQTPSITSVAVTDIALVGTETEITWASAGVAGAVDILLSLDSGSTYPITIVSGTTNDGSYNWTPAAAHLGATVTLKVQDTASGTYTGESSVFIVATTSGGGLQNTDLWYRLKQAAIDNGLEIIEQ